MTGTDSDGHTNEAPYTTRCGDWTNAGVSGVQAGRTDAVDARWVAIYPPGGQAANACTNMGRLYCVGPY